MFEGASETIRLGTAAMVTYRPRPSVTAKGKPADVMADAWVVSAAGAGLGSSVGCGVADGGAVGSGAANAASVAATTAVDDACADSGTAGVPHATSENIVSHPIRTSACRKRVIESLPAILLCVSDAICRQSWKPEASTPP